MGPLESLAASQGGGCFPRSAGTALARQAAPRSCSVDPPGINGEVPCKNRWQGLVLTLNGGCEKSLKEVETRSVAFLQSTSYYRSYRRLNSHFCQCQLRCKAAGQVGAIKKPLHPLLGLPRVFAECQVQAASLEQELLVLILMMLGFISKAQEVVLVWKLNKRTSEIKSRIRAKLQE